MSTTDENIAKLIQEANGRSREFMASCINVCNTIKWKTVSFVIPTDPIPSHRPRLSGYRIYVPGAAKNQAFFNKHVLPSLKGLFISTPCELKADIYVRTPK